MIFTIISLVDAVSESLNSGIRGGDMDQPVDGRHVKELVDNFNPPNFYYYYY